MTDRLFLVQECPDCDIVKAALDLEVVGDDFIGKAGRHFVVLNALTNEAGRELLDKYGLQDKFAPVLLKDDGTTIVEPQLIVDYLKQNGMA